MGLPALRGSFAAAKAVVHSSDDRLLGSRDTIPGNGGEILQWALGGGNRIVQRSLDNALGKKHNVVVKKAGAMTVGLDQGAPGFRSGHPVEMPGRKMRVGWLDSRRQGNLDVERRGHGTRD
jgi:hypothetical protein